MRVIDSDGHFHEPHYLFEEYIEKEYCSKRPGMVKIQGHGLEEGRWVVEGRVVNDSSFLFKNVNFVHVFWSGPCL